MKKITLVTDNRIGILAEVSEMLGQANINIKDIRVETLNDWGHIQLVVDKYDEALEVFQGSPYMAYTEGVLLAKIEDRPGGLAILAKKFKDAGVDVQSVRIAQRAQGIVVVAVVCDKRDKAIEVAKDLLLFLYE